MARNGEAVAGLLKRCQQALWKGDPGPGRDRMTEQERSAWDKLWADVKATIALAQKPPAATPKK